ncbi:MAG: DUF3718 domain-containing protein [Colwellia sp.]
MKKTILIASLLATTYLMAPISQAAQADGMSLRICEYIQANDKNRLRSFLKQNRLKIRSIYDSIQCNKNSLLIFSAKSNALEVGEFIIGKLPAKKVAKETDELSKYSAHLAEEAKDRIN